MKHLLITLTALAVSLAALAATPTTHTFAVVGNDTLKMDVYLPASPTAEPCGAVLFAFGGGFRTGRRDGVQYKEYFNYLTDNGIAVVSTDYRTQLAHVNDAQMASPDGFAAALAGAIGDAVTDFYTATGYVLMHSAEWGIDPTKIVASGSSAGAITALQAEYGLANGMVPEGIFPQGWNYAGVVSFAGAIFAQGPLQWSTQPCPLMLLHGNADATVPYPTIYAGPVSLNGSKGIAQSLESIPAPVWFYTVAGADHSVAAPAAKNFPTIVAFIRGTAFGGIRESVTATETPAGIPAAPEQSFTVAQYLEQNLR